MKLIAGNFKCNFTRKETKIYLERLDSMARVVGAKRQSVVVFPATACLVEDEFSAFRLGAQNACAAVSGAFTGEVGERQIAEFGIESVMLGHSERRQIFGETQAMLAEKFSFYALRGYRIFYCVGESLEVRESGDLKGFLASQFEGIDVNYQNLVVAYEPIWAIGTGVVASLEQIAQTHTLLKGLAPNSPIIYGGSVNEKNAGEILSLASVDGVLVGTASLDAQKFTQIITYGV